MTDAIDLSTQHQISFFDERFPPLQASEPNMKISKGAAVSGLKEMLPLLEPEMGILKKDMHFLLTKVDSFHSDCKNNANVNESCTSSNSFAFPLTQQNTYGGIPVHEKSFISNGESLGPFGIDVHQEKDWMQSYKENKHPSISKEISIDAQFLNSNGLEDSLIKPISIHVSKNGLPELDMLDCLSLSDESTVEGYLSVFEESDFDCHDNTEPINQSFANCKNNIKNDDSSHGIIATAVKSSFSCDDSQRDLVPNILETSLHVTPHQEKKWLSFYTKLQQFQKEEGHCCVPGNNPKHKQLANWIKRQRRQYKNTKNGRKSAMTMKRINMLDRIGFIWDSHDLVWRERLEALKAFRREFGHCNVPSRYSKDKQLGIWVKCQRHQYKLYREGKSNSMGLHRISLLNNLGFEWIGKSCKSSTLKHM